MTKWIYLPENAKDMREFGETLIARDKARSFGTGASKYHENVMEGSQALAGVAANDTVWVMMHGRKSTANQAAAEPVDAPDAILNRLRMKVLQGGYVYLTAPQLADRMTNVAGLPKDRPVKIKLAVCWAGLPRTKGQQFGHKRVHSDELPFAAQLYLALRKLGHHEDTIVIGYLGGVKVIHYNTPHKLISNGFDDVPLTPQDVNPIGPNWGENQQSFNFDGISLARDQKAGFGKEWLEANRHHISRSLL